MSTVTPASIVYTPSDGEEVVIDFHAVMIEDHATQATITKYPVQEGFHVSNHSIRNNRIVNITAMISNMRFSDAKGLEAKDEGYGKNATQTVKEIFDGLIFSGQECKVITNLGVYNPVVFSRFKTTQKSGMVDSMELTITGEEIIKVNTDAYNAPKVVTFTEIFGASRAALVEELKEAGIEVGECDKLSQGSVESDESFIINAVDAAGKAVSTVFEFLGNDPVTRSVSYAQSVVGVEVIDTSSSTATNSPCTTADPKSAMAQIGGCLLNEFDDIVSETTEDLINTALGSLTKTIRGVFYDTVTMDSGFGQTLATAGLGCIIRGVSGDTESTGTYIASESLPTATDILNGDLFGTPRTMTLTKLECDCSDKTKPVVDTSLLPIDG